MLFVMIGIAAILLALVFFIYFKSKLHKGAAVSLFIIGLIHFVAGTNIFYRCDKERIKITYAYDMNPGDIRTIEILRMEMVNKNLLLHRYTVITLLLAGSILYFFFKNNPDRKFWVGMGLVIAIEAAVGLGGNYFAEKRASIYTNQLKEFVKRT